MYCTSCRKPVNAIACQEFVTVNYGAESISVKVDFYRCPECGYEFSYSVKPDPVEEAIANMKKMRGEK